MDDWVGMKEAIEAGRAVTVEGRTSGAPDMTAAVDRWTVAVPYARSALRFRIVMNATHHLLPPDVIFLGLSDSSSSSSASSDDCTEACSFSLPASLVEWKVTGSPVLTPPSLGPVLLDLVEQYRVMQEERLGMVLDVVRAQYDSVRDLPGVDLVVSPDEVTVVTPLFTLDPTTGKPLAPTPPDAPVVSGAGVGVGVGAGSGSGSGPASSAPVMPWLVDGHRLCLEVKFVTSSGKPAIRAAILAPSSVFKLSRSMKAPSWPAGATLANYRSLVVQEVSGPWRQRREFCTAVRDTSGCFLEHDDVDWSFTSLLFSFKAPSPPTKAVVCAKIDLTTGFPTAPPTITLQAMTPADSGTMPSVILGQYPYSPRWDGPEMASRILKVITGQLPLFHQTHLRAGAAGAPPPTAPPPS